MDEIVFHGYEDLCFPDNCITKCFCFYDYSAEIHDHDFWEINVIMSGKGIHCLENARFQVAVGDVFVLPPWVAHGYIETDKLDVYHMNLKKCFMNQNFSEAESVKGFLQLTEIEPYLRQNFSDVNYLHLTPAELVQFQNDIAFIDLYNEYGTEEFTHLRHHTIWKILYWFSNLLDKQNRSLGRNRKHKYELQIIQSMEFIHQHYDEKITIESLCKQVFLSRATFLRSFEAICGISPTEYLSQYRCTKARELLDAGEGSKTEIAHKCGFYDLSHMERMLKIKNCIKD